MGSLMIIGGSEDRTDGKAVLERFVQQAGGPKAAICVLTAASTVPDTIWAQYDEAFAKLGAGNHSHLKVDERAQADAAGVAEKIARADGIFITGGAQERLIAATGDTLLHKALHEALQRGACIAGTSAGASAMAQHMLVSGKTELQAEKGAIEFGKGYGFASDFVIDQHFSQRHRLSRLLSAVAENPQLVGLGIDEDTALLIEQSTSIEVLGGGAVTVIDGRQSVSNAARIKDGECLEIVDVRLHVLPSGTRYRVGGGPAPFADLLQRLINIA